MWVRDAWIICVMTVGTAGCLLINPQEARVSAAIPARQTILESTLEVARQEAGNYNMSHPKWPRLSYAQAEARAAGEYLLCECVLARSSGECFFCPCLPIFLPQGN